MFRSAALDGFHLTDCARNHCVLTVGHIPSQFRSSDVHRLVHYQRLVLLDATERLLWAVQRTGGFDRWEDVHTGLDRWDLLGNRSWSISEKTDIDWSYCARAVLENEIAGPKRFVQI